MREVDAATPGAEVQATATAGPIKSALREYAEILLLFAIAFVFSRAFIFQQSKIPSGSMEDTLLIGDYIMVNRFSYAPTSFAFERALLPIREVRRGDIVVFKHPRQPELQYIKRVAGLPGDVVQVRDGALWVNGRPFEEPWLNADYRHPGQTSEPTIVQPGHYFMLGDHRDDSSDSRVWGQVPGSAIKGRALLIWWSFEEDHPTAFPSLADRVRGWVGKLVHFFGRTRWERCFTVIR